MKKFAKNKIYDKLHRGVVMACMGLTAYGMISIAYFGYNYYVNVKPELKARGAIIHKELLQEGSSEMLLDKIPDIKS